MVDNLGDSLSPCQGQSVPFRKVTDKWDNLSVHANREAEELVAFKNRLRAAREAAGFTQAGMAKALWINLDAYKKYENREGSAMPLMTFARFIEITAIDPMELLRGKRHTHPFSQANRTAR